MASPHKKPTKIKELSGTLEKSRTLDNEMDTSLVGFIPESPEGLPLYAGKLWDLVCRELHRIDMLHNTDLEQLKSYCIVCYIQDRAFRELETDGYVIIQTNKGGNDYSTKSPWVSILNEAQTKILAFSGKFGLTPSDRAKIEMPEKESEADGLESITKLLQEVGKASKHDN